MQIILRVVDEFAVTGLGEHFEHLLRFVFEEHAVLLILVGVAPADQIGGPGVHQVGIQHSEADSLVGLFGAVVLDDDERVLLLLIHINGLILINANPIYTLNFNHTHRPTNHYSNIRARL